MTPPDIVLRETGARDVGEMMTVMREAFDPSFGEAWNSAQCLGILGLPSVWLTLASADRQPAGFALARVVADEAELLLLAVRPCFRRRGIGQLLIGRTLAVAAAAGARTVHLEVRDGNDAFRLYQNSGFAEVGRRRGYYRGSDGKLFDALTLSFTLEPERSATNILISGAE
ncbi:MAG: ribosomal-protein-alanine acetyltransferase [Sphingomonas bacterium]|nr:ribosomal-protein-alanine acetyltransferase [Sphingomonas bacterium]